MSADAPEAGRRVDALFARYGESHRHPTNKAIHWVCVPLITWSLLAMLWWLSPAAAYVLIGIATLFYLKCRAGWREADKLPKEQEEKDQVQIYLPDNKR